jgi:endonuclease YncB( thermonuclease family)
MDQKKLLDLINLAKKLHRQKYPIIAIIVMVGAAFVGGMYNTNENLFGGSKPPTATESIAGDACKVYRVSDADTATVECPNQEERTRVRFYCVDAPETSQDPWGKISTDYLLRYIKPGSMVKVKQFDKDRYGRIVGELHTTDGVNLNLTLVKAGMVAVYPQYCKDQRYYQAESTAKASKLGIWAEPGLHQTPWEYRRQNR